MSQLTEAEAVYRAVRQEIAPLSDVRLGHRYRKLRRKIDTASTEMLVELAAVRHAMRARGLEVPR